MHSRRISIDGVANGCQTSNDDGAAFVVQDRSYLSARWPGDAYLFAERFLRLLQNS
jgi:hypothetical protein